MQRDGHRLQQLDLGGQVLPDRRTGQRGLGGNPRKLELTYLGELATAGARTQNRMRRKISRWFEPIPVWQRPAA